MKLARAAAILTVPLSLAGCIGIKTGGEGVFKPTSVQPPSFERGSGLGAAQPSTAETPEPARPQRELTIPNR